MTLAPGATVLLYTDGLVERRGSTLDDGHGPARRPAGRAGGQAARGALRRPARGDAAAARPQDDVALVAVRLGASHPAG